MITQEEPLVYPIEVATRNLAQAACDLDWNKEGFPPHLQERDGSLARQMHDLVDELEALHAGEGEPAGPGWAEVTAGMEVA